MAFFVEYGKIFKIVRETEKTFFYKEVKPSKQVTLDGVFFMPSDETTFRKYSLDNIILEDKEYKVAKKRYFLQYKVIEILDIERVFFQNHKMLKIDEYMEFYHLFLHEEELLKKAYILRKYVLSLTSGYLKHYVFSKNSNHYKKVYNEQLDKLKELYIKNKDEIDWNIDKIRFTINQNFYNLKFEEKFKEALELQPV